MNTVPPAEPSLLKCALCFCRILLVVLAVAVQFTPVRADEEVVTVFTAKKIYTMDPGWPKATTVAVQDGTIVGVGTFDDVRISLGTRRYVTDETLREKVLLPGFIETHGHPLTGAIARVWNK
jgi:cytosine/adenosine deaminase-related metal-dependent hydrolase